MPKQPVNLFPEDLLHAVNEVFALYNPQPILLKIAPFTAFEDNFYYNSLVDGILHPRELDRFSGYTLTKRRSEFLAGRYCAKIAISSYLHIAYPDAPEVSMDNLEISSGPGGRPAILFHGLQPSPPMDISIAHSGEYAAALAASDPCGIDLQHLSTTLPRVQSRFCTRHELRLLQDHLPQTEQLEQLTLVWAAKEAAKKALSYWRMPGFLDIEVVDIRQRLRNCRSLLLCTKKGELPRFLRQITVVVSKDDNYGLAVCIIKKDEINA